MTWKKLGKALLFPHPALLWCLLPICIVGLPLTMLQLQDTHPIRMGFYLLSFYTLTICCARVPGILSHVQNLKQENPYARRWFSDLRFRTNITLSGNVAWNTGYAALQLGLGIYHHSLWFYSLSLYYVSLAIMRLFLVKHTLHHAPGEHLREEWHRYRICGWVFLLLNMALTVMIFYMVYRNRTVRHHEITTISMAAYTFTSLTMAIINVIKYRRLGSPVFSASKAISLASGCVSMLTLEGTMLTTFRSADMPLQTQQLFLGISGGVISVFILVMAIYLIVHGNQQIKSMEKEYESERYI